MRPMSEQWQSLIRKLWAPDGGSHQDLLPEIVDAIKATKSRAEAEKGLFTIFLSPAVQGPSPEGSPTARLLTSSEVTPGYQARKIMADAAGLPLALVKALNEHVPLTPSEIVYIFECQRDRFGLEKADGGSAQAQSTKRARRESRRVTAGFVIAVGEA